MLVSTHVRYVDFIPCIFVHLQLKRFVTNLQETVTTYPTREISFHNKVHSKLQFPRISQKRITHILLNNNFTSVRRPYDFWSQLYTISLTQNQIPAPLLACGIFATNRASSLVFSSESPRHHFRNSIPEENTLFFSLFVFIDCVSIPRFALSPNIMEAAER